MSARILECQHYCISPQNLPSFEENCFTWYQQYGFNILLFIIVIANRYELLKSKVFPHILQAFCANNLWHLLHWNGFSPEWTIAKCLSCVPFDLVVLGCHISLIMQARDKRSRRFSVPKWNITSMEMSLAFEGELFNWVNLFRFFAPKTHDKVCNRRRNYLKNQLGNWGCI